MKGKAVIAVFDVGKTNKKVLLFDQHYQVAHEESSKFAETVDDDGFACENLALLTRWVKETFERIKSDPRFDVKAVNFSAYGASFVYLDESGNVLTPLYNYLKPYPKELQDQFYKAFGGESRISSQTASPILGSLNSGMQLYRIRQERPALFAAIKYALHLPQYLSYILSGEYYSDITSIGCHTNLWDYQHRQYHPWVQQEGISAKLPPILPCTEVAATRDGIAIGAGLHDSSAALIPYLASFRDPFILLSTGTWCITLNPFNHSQLSHYELDQDCLSYLSFGGNPVKASRLFAGHEHEQEIKRLAKHFNTAEDYYTNVKADIALLRKLKKEKKEILKKQHSPMVGQSAFGRRKLEGFSNYEEAYHQLIADITDQQVRSTNLVLKGTAARKIFVDGGFSRNEVYMNMLSLSFSGIELFAASVAQASSMGAALAIHAHWCQEPIPQGLVKLKQYTLTETPV